MWTIGKCGRYVVLWISVLQVVKIPIQLLNHLSVCLVIHYNLSTT